MTEKLQGGARGKSTLATLVTDWSPSWLSVAADSEARRDSGCAHTLHSYLKTCGSRSWHGLTRWLAARCRVNLRRSFARRQGYTEHSDKTLGTDFL